MQIFKCCANDYLPAFQCWYRKGEIIMLRGIANLQAGYGNGNFTGISFVPMQIELIIFR
jgi:hypothetical protein